MTGTRGKLRLPAHLRAVPDDAASQAESAADQTPRLAPLKPEGVTANTKLSALWDAIVPQLDECGLVAPSDGPAVELALRHYLLATVAADQISDDVTSPDRDGAVKKHPAEAVFRLESDMFLKYAAQLGMTFVSRARTPASKGGNGGEANPFAPPVG